MAPDDWLDRNVGGADLFVVAAAYNDVDQERADAERRLLEARYGDDAREQAWQELEALIVRCRELLLKLTSIPSATQGELRVKAAILHQLLQPAIHDPSSVAPELLALALAVSTEACDLLGVHAAGRREG